MFVQRLANGLSVGSVCALMVVGYALIYSLMDFTNFAHSITVTIDAFTTSFLLTHAMQGLLTGTVAGIIAAALLAAVIEFVAYCPLLKRDARRVYLMIIRLEISAMGDNLIIIASSDRSRISPVNFPSESMKIMGVNVGLVDMLTFLVSMIPLLVVKLIIRKTKLGLAIRSAAFNLEATSLMGADTFKLISSISLIAGSLTSVAGTLLGARYTAYPSSGTFYTNKAFIYAVFGRLGSLPGAVMRALVLGVSETMMSVYVSTSLRDLFAYFLLIVILLIRPSGLVGRSSEDKA